MVLALVGDSTMTSAGPRPAGSCPGPGRLRGGLRARVCRRQAEGPRRGLGPLAVAGLGRGFCRSLGSGRHVYSMPAEVIRTVNLGGCKKSAPPGLRKAAPRKLRCYQSLMVPALVPVGLSVRPYFRLSAPHHSPAPAPASPLPPPRPPPSSRPSRPHNQPACRTVPGRRGGRGSVSTGSAAPATSGRTSPCSLRRAAATAVHLR